MRTIINIPIVALIAKFVLFGAVCVWDLILLSIGIILISPLIDYLEGLDLSSVVVKGIVAWYMLTVVVVGMVVALKGFLVIGKWDGGDTNGN